VADDDLTIDEACPFCGVKVMIDGALFLIVHRRPTCSDYDRMSAHDFIAAVREKVAADLELAAARQLGYAGRMIKGGDA
jgi:hypothetical protein